MFTISNNIIRVNRGDYFTLPISLVLGETFSAEPYEMTATDALYVGILEPNQQFENAIVKKKLTCADQTGDKVVVTFWPEDTLRLAPGKYFYQVKLERTDATTSRKIVTTILDKTLLFLEE